MRKFQILLNAFVLTLCIPFVAPLFAQPLTSLGSAVSKGAAGQIDIAVDNGTPYVAYTEEAEERQIHLKKFNGSSWEEVGKMPPMAKTGDPLDLVIEKGIPYILFSNGSGMTVAKFADGEWKTEGKPDFAADISTYDAKLCFVKGKATVIYENKTDDKLDMHMLEKNGKLHIWTAWDAIDQIPSGVEQPSIATLDNGEVYLAWFDRSNDKIGVSKISSDGESLEDVSKGNPGKDASQFLGLTALGDQLLLAYENKKAGYVFQVMSYNKSKSKWEAMNNSQQMSGEEFCMTDDLSIVYLAENKHVVLHKFNGEEWIDAADISESEASMVKATLQGQTRYVAYLDAEKGNKVFVRKY